MRKVNLMLVVTIVSILLVPESAFGRLPKYEIIDLGTLGGSSSYPTGINDAGEIIGTSPTADGRIGRNHAFLWDDVSGMIDMTELIDESLGWDYVESAIAINNNGQIVGRVRTNEPIDFKKGIFPTYPYFLWDSETGFVELTAFESPLFIRLDGDPIRAINDSAQIVGVLPESDHACLWDSINGMIDLGTLGGITSYACNINAAGKVVGASRTGFVYENGRTEAHAFLWDNINGMIDLGTLNGKDSSAWAINNSDKVVGASVIDEPDENLRAGTVHHAFVWTGTDGMIDIHDSSYLCSIALAINDADQTVGILSDNMFVDHSRGRIWFVGGLGLPMPIYSYAFLWDKSCGMVNLNDLLDEDSGWDCLTSARGINNKGQIIGTGYINGQRRGFLLSPVPPIPAEVDINPKTLNLSGKRKWIRCRIWLPEDYDVADVNTDSILLEDQTAAAQVWVNKKEQVVMVKFSRADVQGILEAGEVELIVSGELIDGTRFEGMATIRVIDKGGKKN